MHILTDVLLAVAAGAALLSSLGILMLRDFYERLHYMGPTGSLGAAAIVASLLLNGSLSSASVKVIMVGVLLVISNSVLTHATARAGRIHQLGDWKPQKGEDIVREEPLEPDAAARHRKKARHPGRKHSRK